MKLLVVFALVLAAAFAAPEGPRDELDHSTDLIGSTGPAASFPIEQEDHQLGEYLTEDLQQDTEARRKKKSTTTTFCVEVRPNNPYQKPYELCESGNEVYAVPSSSSEQAYGQASVQHPAPSPAPVYGAPQKTSAAYGAPAGGYGKTTYPAQVQSAGYVQSAAHSAADAKSYPKKYRANEDEDEEEFEDENGMMRSAGYGGNYGGGYGGGYGGYGGGDLGIIKFTGGKKGKKGHGSGHGGLVITCQPNLAGYASHVAGGGYGGGYGGYRNADEQSKLAPAQGRSAYSYGNTGFNTQAYQNQGFSNGMPNNAHFSSSASSMSGYGAPHAQPQSGYGFSAHSNAHQVQPAPMGVAHHSGYAPAPMTHQNGYAPAAMTHQSGYAPAAMTHQNGYAPAAMTHQSGYAPAPMTHQNGYAQAGPAAPSSFNYVQTHAQSQPVPSIVPQAQPQGYGAKVMPMPQVKFTPQVVHQPTASYGNYRNAEGQEKGEERQGEKEIVSEQRAETMGDGIRSGGWSADMRSNEQHDAGKTLEDGPKKMR